MPGVVTSEPAFGVFGKLPARGDFIRTGLPRDFTDPWDEWLQAVLRGSRAKMQQDWLPAWLEAPVWRFCLGPETCGARTALGLMLPSVDRAGRYFPLTFAAVAETGGPALGTGAENWLDACEGAGRAALDHDLPPERIIAMVPPPQPFGSDVPSETVWWTGGAPRVPATRLTLPGLPDEAAFIAMLDAAWDAHAAGVP